MFIQNKYTNIYFSIINRAKSTFHLPETYTEKHHIIPKSLGGSNAKDNLVVLTAREHYICHLLLTKMVEGTARRGMWYALNLMQCKNRTKHYQINSTIFALIKREVHIAIKERCNTPEYKLKISIRSKALWNDPAYLARQLEISKDPLINAKKKHVGKDNGMYGKTHSDKIKQEQGARAVAQFAGKTYEEIYGIEKANKLRATKSASLKSFIANNPMIRKGSNNANAKCYEFTNPFNEKIIVCGQLKQFCKNNMLDTGIVIDLLKGRRTIYKGWTATYI